MIARGAAADNQGGAGPLIFGSLERGREGGLQSRGAVEDSKARRTEDGGQDESGPCLAVSRVLKPRAVETNLVPRIIGHAVSKRQLIGTQRADPCAEKRL